MVQDSCSFSLAPIRVGSRVGTVEASEVSPGGPPTSPVCRKFIGDPMDRYLASIGLVKKLMPNDRGSSVFRAVCESLAYDQSEYLELKELVEEEMLFRYRLQRLRTGLARVNRISDTLETISRILRIDLYVYRNPGEEPQIIRCPKREKKVDKVFLCESSYGHFDLIYTFEDHKNLAYAQSIVYNLLYVHVFGFSPDVIKEAIDKVRADMDAVGVNVSTPSSSPSSSFTDERFIFGDSGVDSQQTAPAWRPPIPYSALKAMDPSIYRNIAYDLYARDKREEREEIDQFRPGTFCFFVEEGTFYEAFIISVPDQRTRLAVVEGSERRVSTCDLFQYGQPWSVDTNLAFTGINTEVTGNDQQKSSVAQATVSTVMSTSSPARSHFVPNVAAPVSYDYNRYEGFLLQCVQNPPIYYACLCEVGDGNQSNDPSQALMPVTQTINPWYFCRYLDNYYGNQDASPQQEYLYAPAQKGAVAAFVESSNPDDANSSTATNSSDGTLNYTLHAVMQPSFKSVK